MPTWFEVAATSNRRNDIRTVAWKQMICGDKSTDPTRQLKTDAKRVRITMLNSTSTLPNRVYYCAFVLRPNVPSPH